jgi:hypothetical protein
MNAIDQYQKEPDVDRMLSAFFKSEMPGAFPPLKLPAGQSNGNMPMPVAANLASGQWNASVVKSRLSLAASVALLVGGCWYVSSQIGGEPAERPATGKGDLSAKIPKELLKAQQEGLKNP